MKNTKGIDQIVWERRDQIIKHERSVKYDVITNSDNQITKAIEILCKPTIPTTTYELEALCPLFWNKDIWYKMCRKPHIERLAIAGAFCAAEIDRLQYDYYIE